VNKSQLDAKQDKLTAGPGITIVSNTIAATGGAATSGAWEEFVGGDVIERIGNFYIQDACHGWVFDSGLPSGSNGTLRVIYIGGDSIDINIEHEEAGYGSKSMITLTDYQSVEFAVINGKCYLTKAP
jgi:hypothetical protein